MTEPRRCWNCGELCFGVCDRCGPPRSRENYSPRSKSFTPSDVWAIICWAGLSAIALYSLCRREPVKFTGAGDLVIVACWGTAAFWFGESRKRWTVAAVHTVAISLLFGIAACLFSWGRAGDSFAWLMLLWHATSFLPVVSAMLICLGLRRTERHPRFGGHLENWLIAIIPSSVIAIAVATAILPLLPTEIATLPDYRRVNHWLISLLLVPILAAATVAVCAGAARAEEKTRSAGGR